MLSGEQLGRKTYEEWIAQAVGQIPVYSREWTNFNPSDPGITILENLTAFEVLQQESILAISDKAQEKLLEMAGFYKQSEQSAAVLLKLSNEYKTPIKFLKHQKFYTGDICFEIGSEEEALSENILGIFRKNERGYQNLLSEIQKNKFTEGYALFGENPEKEDEIFFLFSRLPEQNNSLELYIVTGLNLIRNEDSEELNNLFAMPEFSLLTDIGFCPLKGNDGTEGFIRSGRITLDMPEKEGILSEEFGKKGYIVRCLLREADYDLAPVIKDIHAFLIPVIQKDTKAAVLRFEPNQNILVRDAMTEEHYITCFCKEGKSYHKYYAGEDIYAEGRYYQQRKTGWGEIELSNFRNVESKDITEVLCVLSSEEIMIHQSLGIILGYDEQEISLEPFTGILKEEFYVMTKIKGLEGEEYQLFSPEETEQGNLKYRLEHNNQILIIEDAGNYEGAELLLIGCAVFRGEEGNIRSGNTFSAVTEDGVISLYNPAPGSYGRYEESLAQRKERFAEDLHHSASLVTKDDFEEYVKNLPELCIHKVNAYKKPGKQKIYVAVKPYGKENFPKMSPLYHNMIHTAMEEKRMLSTKIELVQPIYTAVHVDGTIYIKEYYSNYKEKIEETIRILLDYINTERKFGEILSFYEVYDAIEKLDCVDEVFELSITAENTDAVKKNGLDLEPAENCLCYPGEIRLFFHSKSI